MGRASLIGAATLTSRFLGMVREHVFARIFGASADVFSDAFMIAYRIPNLLRDLFAEGALSAAFIPTFTDYRENRNEAAAFHLAQIVFSALFLVLGGLVLLGILFAPAVVSIIAPGFDDPEKRALTISLTRWLMPFILLVSWAAVCRGVLNTYQRYLLPALAPALFNVVAVATGYGMWAWGLPRDTAIYGWVAATLVGGAIVFLVQVPSLYRLGLRFRFAVSLAHDGFRRIMRLMAPAIMGLAAVQANVIVNSAIASYLEDGAVSWLIYSFRLVYLPIGVVGVAVATVATVNLATRAARSDFAGFRTDVIAALRLVVFVSVPASLGLIILDQPITRLVYEYGVFGSTDTVYSAAALSCYAWALFFHGGIKILAPGFYALNLLRVPVIASVAAVTVNAVWSLATYRSLGFQALAAGSGIASTVNFAILALAMRRHLSAKLGVTGAALSPVPRSMWLIAKLVLALAPMGLVTWFLHGWLAAWLGVETAWARAVAVLIPVLCAMVLWLVVGWLLRIPEAHDVLTTLRNRLRRPDPDDS